MPGERKPLSRGVDVDVPALGVVDEHRLAEAQPAGQLLPGGPVRVRTPVAHHAEGVAVPAVGAAEHAQYVDAGGYAEVAVAHMGIQAPPGRRPFGRFVRAVLSWDADASGGTAAGHDHGSGAGPLPADPQR
ncbi:hypothetical protein SAMN02787144_1001474 [Streptomyces atratus]|uniref:Uncharacterized protein n=1 Tax=Streptomyces atratus TaxID=1893 RepID=A0A1K1UBY9_STRAR|nr:hypothetical protein SAMN02787144_1001474 [Streptomyces atratus]